MGVFEDRYVEVGGVRTRFWQAGSQGSPVILLHGIGCSVMEWEANIAALAARHRVYAVDLLGYGLTAKPASESYTVRRLAQFVLGFLDSQHIQRAHVAGFSLGGRVALECAIVAPERVSSLVLLAPAGVARKGLLIHFRLASIPFLGEMIIAPSVAGLKTFWRLAFFDPSYVTAEFVTAKLNLAVLPGAKEAMLKTLRSGVDFGGVQTAHVNELRAALPAVTAPTLVVWGKQDRFIAANHADTLAKLLPDVRIEIRDPCGHLPQIENAEWFNGEALKFWDRLDRPVEQVAVAVAR